MGRIPFHLLCCSFIVTILGAQEDKSKRDTNLETCDERFPYMDFLENNIKNPIDDIIHGLSLGVRGNYDVNGLVEEMLEKLIGMRDKILHRIKNIRKNDIQTCKEQGIHQEKMLSQLRFDVMNLLQNMIAKHELSSEHIKEITDDLLTIREIVIDEKMRLLMLPENKTIFLITNDECSICSKLRKIKDSVKSLLSCSQNTHLADKDGDVRKNRKCIDPLEYKTTLLKINDNLNLEMKNLYTSIRRNNSHFESLMIYKYIQENIDTLIIKLSNEENREEIKRKSNEILISMDNKIKRIIRDCEQKCNSKSCSSCAASIINSTVSQVKSYKQTLIVQKDFEAGKDIIQKGLINFIQKITEDCDKIFVKKILNGNIDHCEQEKLDIHRELKDPLWHIVNVTITAEKVEKINFVFDDMLDQLERYLEVYCDYAHHPSDLGIETRPSCEMVEYGQTKKYVDLIDELIHNYLLEKREIPDPNMVILQILKIQEMFDERLKILYEERLMCADEAKTIKNEYMSTLNRCLDKLIGGNIQNSKPERNVDFSCLKLLRTLFEQRSEELFKIELENSFKVSRPYIFSSSFDTEAIQFGE